MPATTHDKARARLAALSEQTGECRLWQGSLDANGYGFFHLDGRTVSAHRAAYTLHVGPIGAGMDIHHRCGNRSCVAPPHLEQMPHAENLSLSPTASTINAAKTQCDSGHAFIVSNTRVWRGKRACLECERLSHERGAARRNERVACDFCGDMQARKNLARHVRRRHG